MSDNQALQGLTCPRCGGVVSIPEGQAIVRCPYCDLRSVVSGEHGIRHYQVPCRIDRNTAILAYQQFLKSSFAIARDCARTAQMDEAFLAYLPFWAAWGRAMAWSFGEVKVGSGDRSHYEPREVRLAEEMSWNGAACDVGEFGVAQVPLDDKQLEPYNTDQLHVAGMVFEAVSSPTDARQSAGASFEDRVRRKTRLDRLTQSFTRMVRTRLGLVFYPLWVVRYQYRGRSYQVVVDANTGKTLYGKAPGNTFYRAGVLVAGMALGSLVAVDLPALLLSGNNSNNNIGLGVIAVFIVGLAIMYAAYRRFRYGEEYEYHSGPKVFNLDFVEQFTGGLGGVSKIIDLMGR